MSFIFYDTETTGLSTSFDQILQFAAIHTDDDLNELDRFEIRCRLDEYTVPSAGAFSVTGMTIDQVTATDLPSHYEMICQIRERLTHWCPSTFVGWNTMNYDEHLLRQAFYKCLHPVYLTNTTGNQRADIMKLAQCVEAYASDVLVVPLNDKGKPSFKLDKLAPANGFNHDKAHDAMGDVEATIFICRLIRKKAPAAWARMLHCAAKARVEAVINENDIFVLHDYYGSLKEYPLTAIGPEPGGFATLAYDLSIDPEQFLSVDIASLAARLNRAPRVLRRIRSNVGPFVFGAPEGQSVGGIEYGELIRRRDRLFAIPGLVEHLLTASARSPADPSVHVEEQIYDGFPSSADAARMLQFHAAEWCDRYAIVEKFDQSRYRELGLRLILAHCPESLPADIRREQERLRSARLIGHGFETRPWSTLDEVDLEAASMQADGNGANAEMLRGFRAFISDQKNRALASLGLR